ncbi:COMMD4 protein [Operophtera brumata]|uniref:COMMD4 protein n=1 Tax=Operophtera brumata TaxID=104452 RepID=A0A0L7LH38_OPEBR|nr:COMMD4 protein [Operophtera brumata]
MVHQGVEGNCLTRQLQISAQDEFVHSGLHLLRARELLVVGTGLAAELASCATSSCSMLLDTEVDLEVRGALRIEGERGGETENKFKFCADGDCPLWALAALHALGSLPGQLFRALLERVLDEKDTNKSLLGSLSSLDACEIESARAAAAIRWVLRSAWSCACPGSQLAKDLAVLGVPRAHASALAEAAEAHREAYLTFHADSAGHRTELLIEKTQAQDLLQQLKTAYAKMEEMEGSQE